MEDNAEDNSTHEINRDISIRKVKEVIWKCKNWTSPGIDLMDLETLRTDSSIEALISLFNKCVEFVLVPVNWTKALISPIPKNASSDPRVP